MFSQYDYSVCYRAKHIVSCPGSSCLATIVFETRSKRTRYCTVDSQLYVHTGYMSMIGFHYRVRFTSYMSINLGRRSRPAFPVICPGFSRFCAAGGGRKDKHEANPDICPGLQAFSLTNALPVICPHGLYVHKSAHSRPLPVTVGTALSSTSASSDCQDWCLEMH